MTTSRVHADYRGDVTVPRPLAVLVVEDDHDIHATISLLLGLDPGISLVAKCSGAEVLAATANMTERHDLLLLDYHLPEITRIELLGQLRARPTRADTPAIFLIASARDKNLSVYRESGALGMITKPFCPITLADQIRMIMF